MEHEGYVKIWRKSFNHFLWQEKPFDRWHAWQYLIMNAAWKEHAVTYAGQRIYLKAGQLVRSFRKLGRDWGWSNHHKVSRFLHELGEMLMITTDPVKVAAQQMAQHSRKMAHQMAQPLLVISILKFATYQNVYTQVAQQTAHPPPENGPANGPGEKKRREEEEGRARASTYTRIQDPTSSLERSINELTPEAASAVVARYDSLGWTIPEDLRRRLEERKRGL